ncbi:hypothetical protein ACEPAH_6734 [Sanghuangporus vaninii]
MNDVAVCILADSSLNLANQWPIIIAHSISALLGRLHEGRPSDSFHLAVVTYATADYRPTPILAKRYFNSPIFVTKELKEDPLRLGIGRTGSGSRMGMAALEGYAAALELFDHFLSSPRSTKEDKSSTEAQTGPLCHIIHISACQPDESQYPLWNQTTNLDTLTWKSLPDELRKRNINLSLIMLMSNKNLSELHSSMCSETHKPWFKVPESHNVLLSSAASWAPLTVKRANETTEQDKSVDGKRARVSSPKPVPSAPPSQAPRLPTPPKASEKDPPPPSSQANPVPSLPQFSLAQLQQAVAKMRELEPQIKQAQAQAEMLRQQGRVQDMENLRRTIGPKMAMFARLRQLIFAAQKTAAAAAGSANPQSEKPAEAKPENAAGPSGQNQGAPNASSNTALSQPPQVPATQAVQQAMQMQRQGQQINPGAPPAPEARPPPNILPQFSPNIAAQMQKLQAKEGISGLSAMPHHQPQPSLPQQPQPSSLPSQPAQASSNQPQKQATGASESQSWVGTIAWINPQVMTTMEAQVRIITKGNIQPHLWPSRLEIEVLRDQKVSLPVLREWISRYRPILCQVMAIPQNQENVLRFNSLSSVIHDRNTYAIGRRSPGTENVKPMLLLFSMGNDGGHLAAAVFPETGVPELPLANPNPNPNPQSVMNMRPPIANPQTNQLNPQVMAMLQNMNPDQRMQFFARIRQQQQQMQAQAQAQAQQTAIATGMSNPGGGSPPNPNANPVPNPLPNLPGGGWPAGGGMPGVGMGQSMPNIPPGIPPGMNVNLAQALAAMQQQQRQANMQGRPGSGGPPPF